MGLRRAIQKVLLPVSRRVRLMVGRGIIRLVDDAKKEQTVQLACLAGEVKDGLERYQEYGFTSVPHPGAEAILVSIGGNRDHAVVIATGDRRFRLKGLPGGEVSLYDDQGQRVHLRRNRAIEISGADTILADAAQSVTVNAGQRVTVNGGETVTVNGGRSVEVNGGQAVMVNGPSIVLSGETIVLDAATLTLAANSLTMQSRGGGSASAQLRGDININGDVSASGTIMDGAGNSNHHVHNG
jgi:phage baseplate assembly protein V